MIYYDIHSKFEGERSISPVSEAGTSALVGEIQDMKGFDALEYFIACGSLADSDATFTVLVEDGDESDLSDNGSVADAQLIGTEALAGFTFADDNTVRAIGYKGDKRYVRLTITPVGNASAAVLCAIAVKRALAPPVTQNA